MLGARTITVTKTDTVPTLTELSKKEIKQAVVIKSRRALNKGCGLGWGMTQTCLGYKQGNFEELKLTFIFIF